MYVGRGFLKIVGAPVQCTGGTGGSYGPGSSIYCRMYFSNELSNESHGEMLDGAGPALLGLPFAPWAPIAPATPEEDLDLHFDLYCLPGEPGVPVLIQTFCLIIFFKSKNLECTQTCLKAIFQKIWISSCPYLANLSTYPRQPCAGDPASSCSQQPGHHRSTSSIYNSHQ